MKAGILIQNIISNLLQKIQLDISPYNTLRYDLHDGLVDKTKT